MLALFLGIYSIIFHHRNVIEAYSELINKKILMSEALHRIDYTNNDSIELIYCFDKFVEDDRQELKELTSTFVEPLEELLKKDFGGQIKVYDK